MPAKREYTVEFKEQAVRLVLEEISPEEARRQVYERLAPRLSMKAFTLYNRVQASGPAKTRPVAAPGSGSVEDTRAQLQRCARQDC